MFSVFVRRLGLICCTAFGTALVSVLLALIYWCLTAHWLLDLFSPWKTTATGKLKGAVIAGLGVTRSHGKEYLALFYRCTGIQKRRNIFATAAFEWANLENKPPTNDFVEIYFRQELNAGNWETIFSCSFIHTMQQDGKYLFVLNRTSDGFPSVFAEQEGARKEIR